MTRVKLELHALCSRLGISRVADLTGYDRLNVPVVCAVHPNVSSLQNTSHQGKDFDLGRAALKAVMESLERHAAANLISDVRLSAKQAMDSGLADEVWSQGLDSLDRPICWCSGRSLLDGRSVLAPLRRVAFPSLEPYELLGHRPSTTGLAAHTEFDQACLSASLELLERNALRRYMLGAPAARLYVDGTGDVEIDRLLAALDRERIAWAIVSVEAPAGVCVLMALSIEAAGVLPNLPVAGYAAALSPLNALRGALLELVQSRCVALQGSREDFSRYKTNWTDHPEPDPNLRLEQMLEDVHVSINWDEFCKTMAPVAVPNSAEQSLSRLTQAAGELVCFDLTSFAFGMPTARVLAPEMGDFLQFRL